LLEVSGARSQVARVPSAQEPAVASKISIMLSLTARAHIPRGVSRMSIVRALSQRCILAVSGSSA
jgi:hypothetical protein